MKDLAAIGGGVTGWAALRWLGGRWFEGSAADGSAIPVPSAHARRERIVLQGDVPSPAHLPSGCVFHPRCHHPARDEACAKIVPPLEEKEPGHFAACIKQPPTTVDWAAQQSAGGTKPPERYLPVAALH